MTDRPNSAADRLRLVADLFDTQDRAKLAQHMGVSVAEVPDYMVRSNGEVQRDLRADADAVEALESEYGRLQEALADARAHIRRAQGCGISYEAMVALDSALLTISIATTTEADNG